MLFKWQNPELLYLLGIVVVFLVVLWRHRSRSLNAFSPRRFVLIGFALTLLVLALARPQLGHEVTLQRTSNVDVVFAIDISRSMLAQDVTPDRLQFAVTMAKQIIDGLDRGRVALFPFSTDGFFQMPLSNDLNTAQELLLSIDESMTTSSGTDLSNSLEMLFVKLQTYKDRAKRRGRPWYPPQVILFSDGETHASVRGNILSRFDQEQIPIFTVGVGTQRGGPIRVTQRFGQREVLRNERGQKITTKLQPKILKQISNETGGDYFPANLSSVDSILKQLQQSLKLGRLSTEFKVDQELFAYLMILALIIYSFEFLCGRWHYAIRIPWVLAVLSASSTAHAESYRSNYQQQAKAVKTYNEGLAALNLKKLEKAAELFQESSYLTADPETKKKSLFNLGNALLRMQDATQAMQIYQQAYEVKLEDSETQASINQKISENLALSGRIQQMQMQQAAKQQGKEGDGKGGKGKQSDRKGPQKDYEAQRFTEEQKRKMFDLIAEEERNIRRRLQQKKRKRGYPLNWGKALVARL